MFQNVSELHVAMKEVLETVRQGNSIDVLFPKYPEAEIFDLVEAVNACLDEGYLTGISIDIGSKDDVTFCYPYPRVTALGMQFISES